MRYIYLLIFIAAVGISSCKKEHSIVGQPVVPPPAVPPPPPVDPSITQTFLKDIVTSGLPSPYYHFEYDTSGKVNVVSFASGFTVYDVIYDGNRISELRNTVGDNNLLTYTYDNEGRAILITYTNSAGDVYVKVHLKYEGGKLIKLTRERKWNNEFIFNKELTFSYYPDDNLEEITYYFPITPINLEEITYTDHFSEYDNKINVDGFGLLHSEFFDHLVFLPGVQLQKNNAVKETRTGDGMNYEAIYSYEFNSKDQPLSKTGVITITNGTNGGQISQTSSVYSYYQ